MRPSQSKVAGGEQRDLERSPGLSRRHFLQVAGCASLAIPLLSSCALTRPRPKITAQNSKLNHACIGGGGAGAVDVEFFSENPRVQMVALCDVDASHLNHAAQLAPGARVYSDYREMFRQEGARIDSVSVAVPSHMHFAVVSAAIRAGKHVCCQGPLCHEIAEVRALERLAVHSGLVTQSGLRLASNPHAAAAVQWLAQGKVGAVTRVYLSTSRPTADLFRIEGPRPAAPEPPPPQLDWDLWLGTAPERPFASGLYHPAKWRAWQDFGTGPASDSVYELLETVWRGLNLQLPSSVTAEPEESWKGSPERRADTWPRSSQVTWIFGSEQAGGSELAVDWFDGEFLPSERIRSLVGPSAEDFPAASALVLGTEATLLLPASGPPRLLRRSNSQKLEMPKSTPINSYQQFVDACFGENATQKGFQQAIPLAETLLLANIALRFPGETLHWDPAQATFPARPEANRFLTRSYRDRWHVGPF